MDKNLAISIMIDGVPLSELEQIQSDLEDMLDAYPDKRITINIQDEPLVRFR